MSHPLVSLSSSSDRSDARPSVFACRCTESARGSTWLHVAGELDVDTAPLLEQALRRAATRARLIVLDLRELTSMDSSGVEMIVRASIRAWQRDRRLLVVRGPEQVERAFARAQATDVVEIGELCHHSLAQR